jgi:hypothetical protein
MPLDGEIVVLNHAIEQILLEKLTGFQLVKKFSAFYTTRMLINAATSACHIFLSQVVE